MRRFLHRLHRDQSGTAMIELSIVIVLFLLLTFGVVEFGYMLWQYNSAAKAAQLGARMAAVSDPVWGDLRDLEDTGTPGAAWETEYEVVCSGEDEECTSVGTDDVDADTYDSVAMDCLMFGRSQTTPPCDTECAETGIDGENGLCDRYNFVAPENVSITYSHTGLGFAGRPGGPVPTITLRLTGLTFDFFAVGALLGFQQVTMPDFAVTMTGEDLNRLAPE